MNNGEGATETVKRLDIIAKLLAATYARGLKNNDAIIKLDGMKLSREQIAEAVGVTTHNVAQVLYASKKTTGKKKGASSAAPASDAPDESGTNLEVQR